MNVFGIDIDFIALVVRVDFFSLWTLLLPFIIMREYRFHLSSLHLAKISYKLFKFQLTERLMIISSHIHKIALLLAKLYATIIHNCSLKYSLKLCGSKKIIIIFQKIEHHTVIKHFKKKKPKKLPQQYNVNSTITGNFLKKIKQIKLIKV
jgi:hypothetical protein